MVRCLHPASRNLSTRPSDSKICNERGCTTVARSQCIGAERASIRWHGTLRRSNSEASSSPVGPAPTTSTDARWSGNFFDSLAECVTASLHAGNVGILTRGSEARYAGLSDADVRVSRPTSRVETKRPVVEILCLTSGPPRVYPMHRNTRYAMNFKGTLPTLILQALADQPSHGYRIAQRIKARSKGVLDFKEGTLYPALHKLENEGLVASYEGVEQGRTRRYYRITKSGKAVLTKDRSEWRELSRAVTLILEEV